MSSTNAIPKFCNSPGENWPIQPQIIEMIQAVKARNIVLVILNSKGARIANEEEFVKKLASLGVYVYLQFDDFKKSTNAIIRGEDA